MMQDHPRNSVLESWYVRAIDRLLATLAENFYIQRNAAAPGTTLEVPAGAGRLDGLPATISINGKWRWNEATVSRAHPGGASGTYLIFAVAAANVIVNTPQPFTDNTNYAFELRIVANGTTPPIVAGTLDVFRRVGSLQWDGTKITSFTQEVGDVPPPAEIPIGSVVSYAGTTLPPGGQWDWADGGLIDRQVGGVDTTFFQRVGHAYNGGVDPGSLKVRKPDKRGRVSVGADNFGQGAAGRLPNSNRTLGANGGEERHSNTLAENGPHGHNVSVLQSSSGFGGSTIPMSNGTGTATAQATQSSGSGTAHNNLQPYECDNYIVRVA